MSGACFCIGPQNGEPLCPCRMEKVFILKGRLTKKTKQVPEDTAMIDTLPTLTIDDCLNHLTTDINMLRAKVAELKTAPSPEPDNTKQMPVEATFEIIKAMMAELPYTAGAMVMCQAMYRAAIKAAPSPEPDVFGPVGEAELGEPDKLNPVGLLPCPCGKVPTELHIYGDAHQSKWAMVMGDCCNEWLVEFKNHYETDPELIMDNARKAWNTVPRAPTSED